jgi:hypothetical protein
MMELVNGIPCFNCTDVERAKKNGGDDPLAVNAARVPSAIEQARIEARARIEDSQKSREPLNENRPLAAGERGTVFNLLA